MDIIHTETLRGYRIEIMPDTDPGNPRKEYDHVASMYCVHRRYDLGDEQFNDPDAAISDVYDQFFPDEDTEDYTMDMLDKCPIIWLPLYLYDHSGITMSTAPFTCKWDSGMVGFIWVSTAKAETDWPSTEDEADGEWEERIKSYLKGDVSEYDDYITGSVYGYRVIKEDTEEEIDSCWGFYGDYGSENGCLSEARLAVPDEPATPDKTFIMVFHPDGTVEFTRSPSLYKFFNGEGEMQRISEIRKEEHGTRFYIEWQRGKWEGCKHTRTLARNYFNPDELAKITAPKFSPEHMDPNDPMLFDTYEQAVEHEVVILNAMRKAGDSFA